MKRRWKRDLGLEGFDFHGGKITHPLMQLSERSGLWDLGHWRLRVNLHPCLQSHRAKELESFRSWDRRGGEPGLTDKVQVAFKGAEPARWDAILSDEEVLGALDILASESVELQIEDGWLEGVFSKQQTFYGILERVIPASLRLMEAMVGIEQGRWKTAAESLGLDFHAESAPMYSGGRAQTWWIGASREPHEHTMHFSAAPPPKDSTGELDWTVDAWMRWSLSPEQVGARARIRRRDPSSTRGPRTGNPVIDGVLEFEGFSETDLTAMVQQPGATEVLMAALCEHELVLEDQAIRLQKSHYIDHPAEVIQSAMSLARLLMDAPLETRRP